MALNPNQPSYHYGDVVTLTATADPGWTFSGWSGDLGGSTNPATLVMDGNKAVTATFVADAYILDVSIVGSGDVTLNPDQPTYAYGDVVTLTATADPGWTFSAWSGDLGGTTNPATLVMDGDKAVTATFVADAYTLDVSVVGSGSVTITPDQPTYAYGEVVTLTATADPGWTFSAWSGDLGGTANPATLVMDGDKAVTATFVMAAYTLDVSIVGSGSVTITPDQPTYAYGEVVTLTATADPGWTFNAWSGDLNGAANPLTLVMDGDKAVTATFLADAYTLAVDVIGSGSVTVTPSQPTYAYGEVVTLTATANPGWLFSGWSGDLSGPANTHVVVMNGDKSVTATFTAQSYTLDISVTGSGTVTADPAQSGYHFGDTVTLTAEAALGWVFVGWGGDLSGTTNPQTVTVESDMNVVAIFEQQAPAGRLIYLPLIDK